MKDTTMNTTQLSAQQLKQQLQQQLTGLQHNKQSRQQITNHINTIDESYHNICHHNINNDIQLKHEKYKFVQQYKILLIQYQQQHKQSKHNRLYQLIQQLNRYESIPPYTVDEHNHDSIDGLINEYQLKLNRYTEQLNQRHRLSHIIDNPVQPIRPNTADTIHINKTTELYKLVDRPHTADTVNRLPLDNPHSTSSNDLLNSTAQLHGDIGPGGYDSDNTAGDYMDQWLIQRNQRDEYNTQQLRNELARQRTALLDDISFTHTDILSVDTIVPAANTTSAGNVQSTTNEHPAAISIQTLSPKHQNSEIKTMPNPTNMFDSSSRAIPQPSLQSLLTNKSNTQSTIQLMTQHESVDETQYNTNDLSLDQTSYSVAPDSPQNSHIAIQSVALPNNQLNTPDTTIAQFTTNPLVTPEPIVQAELDTTNSASSMNQHIYVDDEFDNVLPPLIQPCNVSAIEPSPPTPQLNTSVHDSIEHNSIESGHVPPQPLSPISQLRQSSTNRALPPTPTPAHTQYQSTNSATMTTTPTLNSTRPLPNIPARSHSTPPQQSAPSSRQQHDHDHDSDESLSIADDHTNNIFNQFGNNITYLGGSKRNTMGHISSQSNIIYNSNKSNGIPLVQRTQSMVTVPVVRISSTNDTTTNITKPTTTQSNNISPNKSSPNKRTGDKPRRTLSGRLLDFLGKNKENQSTALNNNNNRNSSNDSSYDDSNQAQQQYKQPSQPHRSSLTNKPAYRPDTASILGITPGMLLGNNNTGGNHKLPEDDEFDF